MAEWTDFDILVERRNKAGPAGVFPVEAVSSSQRVLGTLVLDPTAEEVQEELAMVRGVDIELRWKDIQNKRQVPLQVFVEGCPIKGAVEWFPSLERQPCALMMRSKQPRWLRLPNVSASLQRRLRTPMR